jgi:4-amino-4-deoxy-L-arabinose transferase-like glycosyltransferase
MAGNEDVPAAELEAEDETSTEAAPSVVDGVTSASEESTTSAQDRFQPEDEPQSDDSVIPILDDRESAPLWIAPRREGWVRFLVLLGAALIFFPNLGSFGLWDPWETHYGAVTTNMVETHDWSSPWWGYKEKIGDEAQQGKHFYSKPVLIFWTESVASRVIGRGEWAIRLPMALLALLAVFMAYLLLSKIWTRRVGLIGAVVMATSPEFFMISRQAQTDMPFVGTLVLALGFFMLAVFGPRTQTSDKRFWKYTWFTLGGLLLNTIPQYLVINMDMSPVPPANLTGVSKVGWWLWHDGTFHAIFFTVLLAALVLWYGMALRKDLKQEGLTERIKDKWLRRYCLLGFYLFAAHSTYAKGLLGFLLPGGILFCYLLVTRTWRLIFRVEILRGLAVFVVVGLPWYLAMFAMHGTAYYKRFFIHDHFNRLAQGVHQIDSGTFEHFIKWLGIGLYPWAAFAPLCLIWLASQKVKNMSARSQAKLMLTVWFVFTFCLFTLASTKFHHYIFPAMPALGMLLALFIDWLIREKGIVARLAALLALMLFLAIGFNIKSDQQHIRNLMTYKYDRPMPKHLPIDENEKINSSSDKTWKESTFWKHTSSFQQDILTTPFFRYENWIWFLMVLGGLGLFMFFFDKIRIWGFGALAMMAVALAMWSLNYYMPSLSPHWSQKYLFDSYYDSCTLEENPLDVDEAYRPILARLGMEKLAAYFRFETKRVCREDVISWRITWRGETYYSYNELQPITKEPKQFKPYLEERNGGNKYYALMERGNPSRLKTKTDRISTQLKRKAKQDLTRCKSACSDPYKETCVARCEQRRSLYSDIKSWNARSVNNESAYFQMVSVTPVFKPRPGTVEMVLLEGLKSLAENGKALQFCAPESPCLGKMSGTPDALKKAATKCLKGQTGTIELATRETIGGGIRIYVPCDEWNPPQAFEFKRVHGQWRWWDFQVNPPVSPRRIAAGRLVNPG